MLIQSVEWCNDNNVMLFIQLHRSSPLPPPPHDVVHACTQENQNAEKLERETSDKSITA